MRTFDASKKSPVLHTDSLEVKEQKYRAAMEEHPEEKSEYLRHLSSDYLLAHRLDEALSTIQEAIASAPKDTDPAILGDYYGWLSLILSWMERDDESIAALEKSVQLEPDDAEPKMQLGQMYEEQKDYKKAVDMFQQAFINPGDRYSDIVHSAFYNYLHGYFDEEKGPVKAKPGFNKLLKAAVNNEQRACMYCAFSYMYEQAENYPLAIDNARKATETCSQ